VVEVLLGAGDGTFSAQTPIHPDLRGASVVAGDFNGDGRADLAVAGYDPAGGQGAVEVLLGAGDGTLRPENPVATPIPPSSPITVVAGDFDGDGRADLAVVAFDAASGQIEVLLGVGDGTFSAQTPIHLEIQDVVSSVVTADLNRDGRVDLVIVGYDGGSGKGSGPTVIQVALSSGGGQFVEPSELVDSVYHDPLHTVPGEGSNDIFILDQGGNILWRKGEPQSPGSFSPPITINPGSPARDIAFVLTRSGALVVSVGLRDDAVTLYKYQGGKFVQVGSLVTGPIPAQVTEGDVNGDGNTDLVVRNAGNGTASVYLGDGTGGFARQADVPIGQIASDIALADLLGTGRLDLVVTNRASGDVRVLSNLGNGMFGDESVYRAGRGPYALGVASDGTITGLASGEATAGLGVGSFSGHGELDIATINPGSNTFAVLTGLGGGTLTNPTTFLTNTPATLIRARDLNGDGISDLALLGSNGVSVYLANGQGGFGPPTTYYTGPNPTGLTVSDGNGDGKLDLLVGNSFGDVLLLVGDGRGHFAPYHNVDGQVALAVTGLGAKGQDTFAYSARGLDQVAAQPAGASGPQVIADRTQGILNPGAVTLADLDGDGIPDLIVANGGANDVLVYRGLGGGKYADVPQTFPAGTDPVGITVAYLNDDKIPDLVVANHGSNDVSILLGQGQGASWTLTPLERLKTGAGPSATVVKDVNGDNIPDLFVSDTTASNALMLKGLGSGFFNDVTPTVFPTDTAPGPIFVGNFTGRPGQFDLVTVNAVGNDVSLFTNINGGNRVSQSFPTGGTFPIAAVEGEFGGNGGGNDLLVANSGDGHLSLFLGAADGLELAQTFEEPGLPNPTALAIDEFGNIFGENGASFEAGNEGIAAAIPVILGFGNGSGSGSSGSPTGPEGPPVVILQPFSPTSLSLIATLLSVPGEPEAQSSAAGNETAGQGDEGITTASQGASQVALALGSNVATTASMSTSTSEESEGQAGGAAAPGGAVTAALPNQSLRKGDGPGEGDGGETEEAQVAGGQAQPRTAAALAPVTLVQFLAGLDASLAQVRLRARRGALWGPLAQAESPGPESSSQRMGDLLARWSPVVVGLGSPALTLAVELARATWTGPGPGSSEAADDLPEAPESSAAATVAEAPEAGLSPVDVATVSIGLATVAWAHAHLVRPQPLRRRHRLGCQQGVRRPCSL
jgi:hypothetical protein